MISQVQHFYDSAPEDFTQELMSFRQAHPPKTIHYKQHDWHYLDCGEEIDCIILWLVGGLKKADAAFRSIPILDDSFRIIAPDYPAVTSMKQLAKGLAQILKAEKIRKVNILAGSFGGMLAQVFVRQFPKKVSKLILSTTTAPHPASVERYQQELGMLREIPDEMAQAVAKERFIEMINPLEEERGFWVAYLDELFTQRLNQQDLIAMYECLIDYHSNYAFSPEDLATWTGEILILESDDDNVFDSDSRESVNHLYPQAHTHTFVGAGHSPASTQRDVYFEIVRKFLRA